MKKIALLSLLLPTLALAGRDGAGNYTLPAGNPVSSGTTITSTWANTTLADIQAALTDSLSRSGKGGMSAAFTLGNGSAATPSLAFTNELSTGLYWNATKDLRVSLMGNDRLRLYDNGTATSLYLGTGAGPVVFYKIPSFFEVAMFLPGKPYAASQVMARIAFTNATTILASPAFAGWCTTAATSSSAFTINKNSGGTVTTIGTLTFSAGVKAPALTFSTAATFAVGDTLELIGPASPDSTLADITFTIQAQRT